MEQDLDHMDTFSSTINQLDITSTTRRHQPPQFKIHFKFSCKSIFSHSLLGGTDDTLPPEVRRITLTLLDLRTNPRQLLRQRLSSWFPYNDTWRRSWIDQALDMAWEQIGSMPDGHNVFVVVLRAVVHHVVGPGVGDEGGGDNSNYFMVPAKESWIESVVEKKIVMMDSCGSTCTVCLEDFGDGSEGVLMPCAHVFHGDCIREWLRTSHYCPVCRFEFPTD